MHGDVLGLGDPPVNMPKSAVEQSRRSLMFDENAERISAAPISSAAATSALPITCSSTFTRLALASLAAGGRRRPTETDALPAVSGQKPRA